jgi:hypothetical protein
MKYMPLLHLLVNHDSYADGRCSDFEIVPTLETQRLLANYRCILKPLPNGIRVLIAVADNGTPFIRLGKNLTIAFHLLLRNPDFALFTDLAELTQSSLRLYTNPQGGSGNPVVLQLAPNPIPPAIQPIRAAFLDVAISYPESVGAAPLDPAVFQIHFAAKHTYWKYYLVTDATTNDVRITDQDQNERLVFASTIDMNTTAQESDPLATTLAQQYPGMRLHSFMSTTTIPYHHHHHPRFLQLFVGDLLAVDPVPNPSIRNYSMANESGSMPRTECLFHVIKFVTYRG